MPKKPSFNDENSLLTALRFISVAQRETGSAMQTHCLIHGGFALAFDGVVAAGYPVPDAFDVGINTHLLIAALQNASGPVTIAQTRKGWVKFRADGFLGTMGDFSAHIPTLDRETLTTPVPDAIAGALDDRFMVALAAVAPLATEKAQKVCAASVLMTSQVVKATNLEIIMEAWHGIDTPQLIIPKEFATAILKAPGKVTGFGFSDGSVTFYFDNGGWIKTQVYAGLIDGQPTWPNFDRLWVKPPVMVPVPTNLFESIRAIKAHCKDGRVYFIDGKVTSEQKPDDIGASITIENLPEFQMGFSIRNLELIAEHVTQIEWDRKQQSRFYGTNLRGVIVGLGR